MQSVGDAVEYHPGVFSSPRRFAGSGGNSACPAAIAIVAFIRRPWHYRGGLTLLWAARGHIIRLPAANRNSLRQSRHARPNARVRATIPDDILVTPGGKFALLTALMGIVNPGDEVLVPQPGWVRYGRCVRLCGGSPVAVPMLDRLDLAAMAAAVTAHTRALILNSPVNPTGRVLSEAELGAVIALAHKHDLWIVFDQVYSDLIYGKKFPYPQALGGGFERTLVVDSLSKSFGMTGGGLAIWRCRRAWPSHDKIPAAFDLYCGAGLTGSRRRGTVAAPRIGAAIS